MSDNSVRHRSTKKASLTPARSTTESAKSAKDVGDSFGVLDILRMIGGLLVMSAALSYFITSGESFIWKQKMPWWLRPTQLVQHHKGPVKLTLAQLKQYDGTDSTKPIYVAVNRTIYDVSVSPQTYGPGGSYNVLAGKDASRAFITGCMDTDLIPDLRGVEEMYVSLWLSDHPEPEELEALVPTKNKAQQSQDKVETEKLFEGKDGTAMIKMVRDKVGPKVFETLQLEAYEAAQAECRAVINNWKRMFDGSGGKDYFEVGTVIGEDGQMLRNQDLGPQPPLCKLARDKRPKMLDSLAKVKAMGDSGGAKRDKMKPKGSLPTVKAKP